MDTPMQRRVTQLVFPDKTAIEIELLASGNVFVTPRDGGDRTQGEFTPDRLRDLAISILSRSPNLSVDAAWARPVAAYLIALQAQNLSADEPAAGQPAPSSPATDQPTAPVPTRGERP